MGPSFRHALASAVVLLACGSASSQESPATSPAVQHYRAYVAAYEQGDFFVAEKEAAAALAAGEAEHDPRIGVFATNLARVRGLDQHDLQGAQAPAQRALDAGGIDLQQAQILVALSRLSMARMPGEESRASSELGKLLAPAARADNADLNYLYKVAETWGYWALLVDQPEIATNAYGQAATFAERLGPDATVERSLALTGVGAAYVYLDDDRKAAAAFTQAMQLVAPFAPESTGPTIPFAEVAYLKAYAWMGTLVAKMQSDGRSGAPSTQSVPRAGSELPPICGHTTVMQPPISYPRRARKKLAVGSIVLRYRISEDGQMSNIQIAASAPSAADFGATVTEAAEHWRWNWTESGPQCRKTSDDIIQLIRFAFD